MSKSGIAKAVSSTLALGLSALFSMGVASCPAKLPPPPTVLQCQYNGDPRAFYCVNTETGKCVTDQNGHCYAFPADGQMFKAAQCLTADDYRSMSTWWDAVLDAAAKRCK